MFTNNLDGKNVEDKRKPQISFVAYPGSPVHPQKIGFLSLTVYKTHPESNRKKGARRNPATFKTNHHIQANLLAMHRFRILMLIRSFYTAQCISFM